MSQLDLAPQDKHRSVDTILRMIPMDPEITTKDGPTSDYTRTESDHDRTIEVQMNVSETLSVDKPRIEINVFPDEDLTPAIQSLQLLESNGHHKDYATTRLDFHLKAGASSELDHGISLLDKAFPDTGIEFYPPTSIRISHNSKEDSIQIWHGPEDKADPKSHSTSICRRYVEGQPTYFIQRSGQDEQKLIGASLRYQDNAFIQISVAAEQLLDKICDDIQAKTPNVNELEDYRRRRYPHNSPNLADSLRALEATKASKPIADLIKFPLHHR